LASHTTVAVGPGGTGDYRKLLVDTQNRLVLSPITINANGDQESVKNYYSEANSVASNVLTTVNTYTVAEGATVFLIRAEISGNNRSTWRLLLNGTPLDRKYCTLIKLESSFEFSADNNKGLLLSPGDVLTVDVVNNAPSLGDFNARLYVVEV
jgi:hypothetical protein